MAFIRRRKSDYGGSHQLIQAYRAGGKVRQRVLANLGRHVTIAAWLAEIENGLKSTEADLARLECKPDWLRPRCCRCFTRMDRMGLCTELDHCVCLHRRIDRLRMISQRYRAEIARLSSLRDIKFTPPAPEPPREPSEADRIIEELVPGITNTWQRAECAYMTQMTRHFCVVPESPICESGY